MTSRVLKIITGAIQIIFAIPFIGLFVSSGMFSATFMLIFHGVTIYIALRERNTISGNVIGLAAALLSIVQSTFFHSIGILIVLYFLLSWFLHVLSAFFIFYGMKKDKNKGGQKQVIDTHPTMQAEQWEGKQQPVLQADQQMSFTSPDQKQQSVKQTDNTDIPVESQSPIKQEESLTRKQSLLREKEHMERSILALQKKHEEGMEFVIDASAVLQKYSLLIVEFFLKNKAINIYISPVVMEELQQYKTNKKQVGRAAKQALLFIEKYEQQEKITFIEQMETDFLQHENVSSRNDDRLIGSYIQLQESHDKKVLLLTNDETLKKKAKAYQLEAALF